jgi:SPW repeat-containing protein
MTYHAYGRYDPNRSNRWQDWINLILAIWLFFSPWILQFGSQVPTDQGTSAAAVNAVTNAAWNAWILSVIVFVLALSAIGRMKLWQEWGNLVLGAWIFIAPWALQFATGPYPAAAWDHWIVGALIVIVSATGVFGTQTEGSPGVEQPHVERGQQAMRR